MAPFRSCRHCSPVCNSRTWEVDLLSNIVLGTSRLVKQDSKTVGLNLNVFFLTSWNPNSRLLTRFYSQSIDIIDLKD